MIVIHHQRLSAKVVLQNKTNFPRSCHSPIGSFSCTPRLQLTSHHTVSLLVLGTRVEKQKCCRLGSRTIPVAFNAQDNQWPGFCLPRREPRSWRLVKSVGYWSLLVSFKDVLCNGAACLNTEHCLANDVKQNLLPECSRALYPTCTELLLFQTCLESVTC